VRSASGVPAAVVVSGAGSGLGRALVVALAQGGGRVALCGRTAESLEQTAALAVEAGADDVMWQALDVADSEGARKFSAAVAERFGVVGGLVNNAGSLGAIGPISDVDLDEWGAGLRSNVVGTATMTSVVAPLLASAPQASIVNVSGAGIGGSSSPQRVSSYVASKAAIVALTEVWSRELAPIRVNAVAPGAVDTGFNNRVLEVGEQRAGTDLVKSVEAQVAAPFPMQPFIDLTLWLLSEQSAWVSGRLLSARWETSQSIEAARPEIENSDLYRLRRADGVLFDAVKKD